MRREGRRGWKLAAIVAVASGSSPRLPRLPGAAMLFPCYLITLTSSHNDWEHIYIYKPAERVSHHAVRAVGHAHQLRGHAAQRLRTGQRAPLSAAARPPLLVVWSRGPWLRHRTTRRRAMAAPTAPHAPAAAAKPRVCPALTPPLRPRRSPAQRRTTRRGGAAHDNGRPAPTPWSEGQQGTLSSGVRARVGHN